MTQYFNNLLPVMLLTLCFCFGCNPSKEGSSEATSETDRGDRSSQNASSDKDFKPETVQIADPPPPLELTAPQTVGDNEKSSQEDIGPGETSTTDQTSGSAGIDHNDPTSYPITKLIALIEGQFAILSWNVESNGAEGKVIGEELKKINEGGRYDIVALTEVLPQDLKVFREALGWNYKYAYSKSGRDDRLQILYDEDKYDKIRHFELDEINLLGRYRAPLVVHLKNKETGVDFLVMVNHLARGKAEMRQEQATKLVEWARDQTLPIIALGDYNFDYVFSTAKGNPAFTNFMRDNIYAWVEPQDWVDTNWYDDPREPDGKDDYPGSMLDFAFVAGPAKDWKTTCTIIVRENDFPDDEKRSDHRPYEVIIER